MNFRFKTITIYKGRYSIYLSFPNKEINNDFVIKLVLVDTMEDKPSYRNDDVRVSYDSYSKSLNNCLSKIVEEAISQFTKTS